MHCLPAGINGHNFNVSEIGCGLLRRVGRRIELTPAGLALLPKARAILEDAAALPRYLETIRTGPGGPLRLGAIPTILPFPRSASSEVRVEVP
jgi:DNA-binding transcriptional LysR family regulator